jgi:hypothetical protein
MTRHPRRDRLNGLCLDGSALLAYASGTSVEPGALIVLAEEEPAQQIWVPALCLGQAQFHLTGSPDAALLDLLFGDDHDIQDAIYDAATSRRVSRVAAVYGIALDVAHAIATAILYRCYLVTNDPGSFGLAPPPDLDILDISQTWK